MKDYGGYDAETIALTAALGFAVIIALLVGIPTFGNLYICRHDLGNMDSKIKHAAANGSLFYAISTLTMFVYTLNCQTDTFTEDIRQSLVGLSIMFWVLGKILLCFVFIHRLYITFKNAPRLAFPIAAYYVLYSVLGMYFFAGCLLVILLYVFETVELFLYISSTSIPIDIIFSCILFRMFQRKLQKVMVDRKLHSTTQVFAAQDAKLMGMMSKLFFLTALTVFASLSIGVILLVRSFAPHNNEMYMVYLSQMSFGWNAALNGTVLFFSLKFTSKMYDRVCKYPHLMFLKCCFLSSTTRLEQKRRRTFSQTPAGVETVANMKGHQTNQARLKLPNASKSGQEMQPIEEVPSRTNDGDVEITVHSDSQPNNAKKGVPMRKQISDSGTATASAVSTASTISPDHSPGAPKDGGEHRRTDSETMQTMGRSMAIDQNGLEFQASGHSDHAQELDTVQETHGMDDDDDNHDDEITVMHKPGDQEDSFTA